MTFNSVVIKVKYVVIQRIKSREKKENTFFTLYVSQYIFTLVKHLMYIKNKNHKVLFPALHFCFWTSQKDCIHRKYFTFNKPVTVRPVIIKCYRRWFWGHHERSRAVYCICINNMVELTELRCSRSILETKKSAKSLDARC